MYKIYTGRLAAYRNVSNINNNNNYNNHNVNIYYDNNFPLIHPSSC